MADNYKMWESLGMDIETHDQLCAVLPVAFGDVYLSQENRPESMDFFDMVVADIHGIRPSELIAHQEKGGKVSACHQNRFNVAVQEMRKALEAGRFGKLSHGSIHVRWNRNQDYYT